MSQIFWNEPPRGYAMSAEEFAAGACRGPGPQPGCGCGTAPMPPAGCDCGCGAASDCPDNGCGQGPEFCQPMICCCRPAPGPTPQPPQVEEGCCCKQSFRAALSLLCDERISGLLDFDASAFLTGTYSAGAVLTCGKPSAGDDAPNGADTPGARRRRNRGQAQAARPALLRRRHLRQPGFPQRQLPAVRPVQLRPAGH